MSRNIEIVPLSRTPANVAQFLQISYSIYEGDPNWVAPLLMDLKKVFTDENPLFTHAEMQVWVARRDGHNVGRIAGIADKRLAAQGQGFYGFFESINDPVVSQGLFTAAIDWVRARGLKTILGPMNPTTNDECGLLINGFDSAPMFMMTYNPPYYIQLTEAAGFRKAKDLLAYDIDLATIPMDRLTRIGRKSKGPEPGPGLPSGA